MAFIKFTERQQKLRQEVREFVERELTPELSEEKRGGGLHQLFEFEAGREWIKKLGKRGWLTPMLPEEYGGMNWSHVDTMVMNDAFLEYGAPAPGRLDLIGPSIVAPTIVRVGTEEQKKEYLPRIARGEIEFCIGYTEPEAGTDLASTRMRAVEEGDYYIVNGQKCFNTHAHCADYHWVLVRSDQSLPGHRGLSLLIVDLKSPGITVTPTICLGHTRTNEVFYDNVRVPKKNRVGGEGVGFRQVMAALQFERATPSGEDNWLLNKIIEFVKQAKLENDPIIRQKLAQMAIEVDVTNLLSYRVAQLIDEDKMPTYESSIIKIFGGEARLRMSTAAFDIMGLSGLATDDSEWAPLARLLQNGSQGVAAMIGAGNNDMLRSYAVTRGFGVPKSW